MSMFKDKTGEAAWSDYARSHSLCYGLSKGFKKNYQNPILKDSL